MRLSAIAVAVCSILSSAPSFAQNAQSPARWPTGIPAQDLGAALQALAVQHHVELIYRSDLVEREHTQGASGQLTLEEALAQLLRGTCCTFRYIGNRGITIVPVSTDSSARSNSRKRPIRLAQSDTTGPIADVATGGAAAAGGLESVGEIVVTATRRSEVLSRVPLSVTAVTQDKLDEQGIKSIADLQRTVPGVVFSPGTNTIAIRGISSAAGASTTGVYIDDTPIQLLGVGIQTANAVPALYDLERVEVLRGPQGTLFGAGAQGGVLRYITPQPSLTTYSGNAKAELGFIRAGSSDYDAAVSFGGPIVRDRVGFRVNAFFRHIGGWIDRVDYRDHTVAVPDANDGSVVGGRLAFAFAPTERLLITPSLVLQNRSSNRSGIGIDQFSEFDSDPDRGIFRSHFPQNIPQPDHWHLSSLKIEYNFDKAQLISNTSYFDRHEVGGYGGIEYMTRVFYNLEPESRYLPGVQLPLITESGVHLPIGDYDAWSTTTNNQANFTQEVRLQSDDPASRWTWVIGAYYQHNRGSNLEREFDPHLDRITEALFGISGQEYFNGIPLLEGQFTYRSLTHTLDRQLAGFGQVDFALTDRLKLTAGVRYSHNEYSYINDADGPINGGFVRSSGSTEDDPVTPKVGLSYQATDNHLFYATYAKGYRIGGVNAAIPFAPCETGFQQLGIAEAPLTYAPDTTQSYEIGSKNRLLDGRLQLASSVYYIQWHGIQSATSIPVCGFRFIDNQGTAVSKGFDVQGQARFGGLVVDMALGYTEAKYTEAITAAGQVIVRDGTSLGAPKWTLSSGAQYNFLAMDHESYVRLDWQHRAQQYGLTERQDPLIPRSYDANIPIPPATDYFTLRLGTHLGERMEVALFADNLLDSNEIISRSHSGRRSPDYRNYTWRPRTISLVASYRF